MRGDSIIVESHHRKAADQVVEKLLDNITSADSLVALTVSGESGSGKSETAQAIADRLAREGIEATILQQDDYFVYPPRTNDQTRRKDISWVGPQEVHLDKMDANIRDIRTGASEIEKPLVIYEEDRIETETLAVGHPKVIISEGTYCTRLTEPEVHIFIDRTFEQTRAHREKRARHASELDPFIDRVLQIEHELISAQKAIAHLVVTPDYNVTWGPAAKESR